MGVDAMGHALAHGSFAQLSQKRTRATTPAMQSDSTFPFPAISTADLRGMVFMARSWGISHVRCTLEGQATDKLARPAGTCREKSSGGGG